MEGEEDTFEVVSIFTRLEPTVLFCAFWISLTCWVIFAIWVSELNADRPKSGKKEEEFVAEAVEGVEVIELFSIPNETILQSE